MAVPRSDWLKDTVWTEYHLSSAGWEAGTSRSEKGRFENEVDPPADRLLTIRSLCYVPSAASEKPRFWSEIRWLSPNLEAVLDAQRLAGVLPPYASALCQESADSYPQLKTAAVMRQPADDRPRPRMKHQRPGY